MSFQKACKFYWLIVFVLLLVSCKQKEEKVIDDPYDHIKDDKVRLILEKAIDSAGGIDNWRKIKGITYTKHSMLFREDSTVELDETQLHEYILQPRFEANILWIEGGNEHLIDYKPDSTVKYFNNRKVAANEQALTESVMSSFYVLGMPFKLLDNGVTLKYEGTATLADGKTANAISATYNPGKNANHSTSDLWWYYFDVKDSNFLGCMVYHKPTYALIQNLEFYADTPVKFHKHRKSYRADSTGNIKFLRAEFWYSDYEIILE